MYNSRSARLASYQKQLERDLFGLVLDELARIDHLHSIKAISDNDVIRAQEHVWGAVHASLEDTDLMRRNSPLRTYLQNKYTQLPKSHSLAVTGLSHEHVGNGLGENEVSGDPSVSGTATSSASSDIDDAASSMQSLVDDEDHALSSADEDTFFGLLFD